MSEEQTKGRVTVGDVTVDVQRFSTFKVLEATRIASEVLEEVPGLGEKVSTYRRTYREQNRSSIPRATAELRYPDEVARITEEAWQAGDNMLELPVEPTLPEVAAHVLPDVFRVAEVKVLRLLAMAMAPNSELRSADENGEVDSYLENKAKSLRHVDAGELLDLLAATAEMLEEQFGSRRDRIRPLAQMLGFRREEEVETEPQTTKVVPPTSPSSSAESSTGSRSDTDGLEESPSTPSPTPEPAGSAS